MSLLLQVELPRFATGCELVSGSSFDKSERFCIGRISIGEKPEIAIRLNLSIGEYGDGCVDCHLRQWSSAYKVNRFD